MGKKVKGYVKKRKKEWGSRGKGEKKQVGGEGTETEGRRAD